MELSLRYFITVYASYKLAKIENLKRGRLGIYTLYLSKISIICLQQHNKNDLLKSFMNSTFYKSGVNLQALKLFKRAWNHKEHEFLHRKWLTARCFLDSQSWQSWFFLQIFYNSRKLFLRNSNMKDQIV